MRPTTHRTFYFRRDEAGALRLAAFNRRLSESAVLREALHEAVFEPPGSSDPLVRALEKLCWDQPAVALKLLEELRCVRRGQPESPAGDNEDDLP